MPMNLKLRPNSKKQFMININNCKNWKDYTKNNLKKYKIKEPNKVS